MKGDSIPRDIFVKSGQKGGKKTALRGKTYYKEIGKKGADTRWGKQEPENSVKPAIQ